MPQRHPELYYQELYSHSPEFEKLIGGMFPELAKKDKK